MFGMETHALIAHLPRGRELEIGRVRSLECAARLLQGLRHELGYRRFEIRELEEQPVTARSMTFAELQAEVRARGYGELIHIARSR